MPARPRQSTAARPALARRSLRGAEFTPGHAPGQSFAEECEGGGRGTTARDSSAGAAGAFSGSPAGRAPCSPPGRCAAQSESAGMTTEP
ncbi:hypothetical protein HEB29_004803 [Streptomyces fulvorobeus]|uniref:Uncharacterized protein n=1 Tax=Streptomyces fulvorobeus TaxID=284028 RepID=A0A7Y9HGE3_9ACTN|nr:hypothetical protein [Streptomyces fulvorobeus]